MPRPPVRRCPTSGSRARCGGLTLSCAPTRRHRGHVPPGCSVQSRGDWAVHFNEREDGVNDGSYTEVNGKKNVQLAQAFLGPDPNKMITLTDARMSSVMGNTLVAANCLVDSGFPGSVCHSMLGEFPWWEAKPVGWNDGKVYDITAVIVRNRENCIGTPRTHGPHSHLFPRQRPSAEADEMLTVNSAAMYLRLSARTDRHARPGGCTDRFRKYIVFVDGEACASGDALGQLGYVRIPCERKMSQSVRVMMDRRDYMHFTYVGVEGTEAP